MVYMYIVIVCVFYILAYTYTIYAAIAIIIYNASMINENHSMSRMNESLNECLILALLLEGNFLHYVEIPLYSASFFFSKPFLVLRVLVCVCVLPCLFLIIKNVRITVLLLIAILLLYYV